MNKTDLIAHFSKELQKDLQGLKEVARVTAEAATHEESKPENQYDTRALEASYLAGAQSKRIAETEEFLSCLKHLPLKSFSNTDVIEAGALVTLSLNDKEQFFFLAPLGGGFSTLFEGRRIQIITPSSPLGEALVGLRQGEWAVVERNSDVLEYEIRAVS
jgi:transcription elongation GreA/GreB family factor